jgi:hypothetical protein
MSLFGDFLKYNPVTAPAYFVGDQLDVTGANAQGRATDLQNQQARLRQGSRQKQLELLDELKGPSVTPQQEARIKALEDESKLNLLNDPAFQGAQQRATRGGAQALSAIQNKQAATGATGGFENIGSMQDVYDRLGLQLADIGQQQTMYKEAKRDTAADLRQGIADAQISFENAKTNAKMAIEAGDAAAAQQALNQAYAAREAIQNRTQQLFLGVAGLGVAAATGNPGSAASGLQNLQSANQSSPSVGYGTNYNTSIAPGLQRDFNAMKQGGYAPAYTYIGR